MKRRNFLRGGAAAGAAALACGLPPRGAAGEVEAAARVEPVAANAETAAAGAQVGRFELDEMTISELQDGLRAGRFTSRSLVRKYLERIEEIDARGPVLRSVIETNPEADEIAEVLDRERKDGRLRGPLHGVPVLVKDNIDTADRMKTTAGSLAMLESKPARDAFVVQRLREAGAVVIGKTNLSEWANFRSTHSSSGWSARGGQTKNPYALDRNPCGSSSGSGAAAAANLCAAAVGTETDGSVVCPSSANSLVGVKPTLGLVSRSGIIPISHSQDTAGPMARTVRDAALLLGALAGPDARDATTRGARLAAEQRADFTRHLSPEALRGARVGVARKFFGFNDKVDRLMADALDALKRLGAVLVDPADIPTQGQFDESEFEVLLYEFKADLNKYLAATPGNHPRTLKELIKFNEDNKDREMPYFGQELFVRSEAKGPLTSRAYLAALGKNRRLSRAQGIDAVMTRHRLDAMVAPTGGPPWPTDLLNGDHFTGGFSSAAAVAGYPHVTVPAGYLHGLPVGLSFFGRALSDARLLGYAYAYEQATKHRRPPRFLARAELPV